MALSLQTIPTFKLDTDYRAIHKEKTVVSSFGMDSTNSLLDAGLGCIRQKV
jgi:hypothetical protein